MRLVGTVLVALVVAAACGVKSWPRPPGAAAKSAGPVTPQLDGGTHPLP